ncbi:beta-lactamase class A-like protein [Bifidobacterium tissieri]|uniref:Beta-lactamase class A-like protein n=1 Tax=Bifidobacterium tissieri TaxID=1630162 RepID=A0A261FHH1_9BIFI|nr:serine hydrolase [Bifidobacterium tissieri]OZG58413.1 beta-lactamase class A-like protein [Bifidobacterium tissieri]
MTGTQPTGAQTAGTQPKKTNAIVPIIIAAVVAALVVTGGVAYEVLRIMDGNVASPQPSETALQTQAPTATPTVSGTPATDLDADKLQSIVNSYSSTDAAVSVRPVEDGDEFDSQQANSKFVAAGFYLPVYLSAKDAGNASAMSSAESMMRTMSNDDGNTAIGDLGGLSALNGWASGAGYGNTDFQRMFGDVAASNSGYENYTSASDATKMLAATAKAGGTDLMSFDLASEGVNAPSGTTLNGHRGQGIKNSYNFFIVMKTGKTDVAVAVLTQNMGKDRAAALTSDILAEVAAEVK